MFILTFLSTVLILSRGKARRVVDGLNVDGGNWDPFLFVPKDLDESPNYDITRWFCEEIGPTTSIPAEINSLWSRWSSPKCNNTCGRGFLVAIASCQDQVTGKPSVDCIGPGSFCCPDSFGKCYCEVNTVDGIMKAARFTEPCISTEGCISSNAGTFTFEGELDPGNSVDFDEAYENDDRERFEDVLCHSKSVRAARRHLLEARYGDQEVDEEYGLRENRLANENFKDIRGYRSVLRSRFSDDAEEGQDGNDNDDNDDTDDDDDDEDENDESGLDDERDEEGDEEDEEDADETVNEPEAARNYDYESAGTTFYNLQIGLALKVAALSVLVWFHEY
ncbi:uncharacterized protein LOC143426271 isoform X3 [Xylocopa sonorina]|uniref:uncharacterized protein LOC143426271 isoform X3 n=1 Tax=Xylocopa sonorina TaxID=1818115 RepID=UPI00403B2D63